MTSKPLFIMVAESIVMRRPIFQVGWFRACSGVTGQSDSAGVSRNGPPEAVSNRRVTSSETAAKALVRAVVLAVHRNQFEPGLPNRLHHQPAACDQNFFVG